MASFRCNDFQKALFISEREGLDKLELLWQDMGYDEADVESRKEKVRFYLNDLISQMVTEQDTEKVALISEIERLLEKADKLGKELSVQINVDCEEQLPLLRVKAFLEERMEKYLICRANRVSKLRNLKDQADELSVAMGKIDFPLLPEVPSEQELEDFQKLIRTTVEEKLERSKTFEELRSKIVAAMERMEQEPELDFERRVILGQGFVLSVPNMNALRELHQRTERRLSETEELVAELREKLSVLWDRLNESVALRENFLFGYEGIGKATIAAIRSEINRCEEKKRANIKQFVLSCREELQQYWDKCHFSVEQREEFRHFKTDLFVEDLLDFHEQELERVKQFYKDNQRLFALVQQRNDYWQRKLDLEAPKSASRLKDNRGGKLLQEEKERKQINRQLPKIEEELLTLAAEFQQDKGEPFLIDGQSLSEFISNQWEEHEAGKELLKRERKVRNQTLGEASATKMAKRKAATPASVAAKRGRLEVPTSAAAVPVVLPQVRQDPQRIAKAARRIFDSKIARRVPAANQNRNPNTVAAAADTTTYTEFQVQLESRVATRSSGKLLACERNATYRAKTPIADRNATYRAKTPVGARTPASRTPLAANMRTPLGTRSPAPLSVAKSRMYTPARNKLPFLI